MIKVARGLNTSALQPLAVSLRLTEVPNYQKEATSDGVMRNEGGASAVLRADALSFDEADALLEQFGLSLFTPSAECTVLFPDLHRIPTPFYGVVTLEVKSYEADWWTDFSLVFTGLVPTWH
jgi:hypothetical protein